MTAFEVIVNGQRFAVAGVGPEGVLSTHVTWVAGRRGKSNRLVEHVGIHVGGLVRSEEHVQWRQRPLHIGDEVRIKIVKRAKVDRPHKTWRRDPAQELREKKRYVRRLAKELRWTVRPQPVR